MTPPLSEEFERRYHKMRADLGLELHKFVKAEEEAAEDEIARMRRRFHIHACILSAIGLLNYLSAIGALSVVLLAALSPALLLGLEYIDRVGRF